MQASATEFRFRYLIHGVIFSLGFWAPWERGTGLRTGGQSTWLTLASLAARNFRISFSGATVALLVLGILLAWVAALLRTWGTAYLGAAIVKDGERHAPGVVAAGPYRFVRHPLYVGTTIHALALALLMPPTGAIFAVLAIVVVQARLIAGEEAFLTSSLGESYTAYAALVPAVLPTFPSRIARSDARPRWAQAIVGEAYMVGVAFSFTVFGWRYNAFLLMQCVLVALGISLVGRALLPAVSPRTDGKKPATVSES